MKGTRSVNAVSVGQCEHFRCTPVKKQKLSQDRKINSFEAAIDQQTALAADAKCQRGFK